MPGGAPQGNKNAAKGRIWIGALNRAIAADDGKRLRAAADKLLDLAAEGDVPALKELGDRLDGKAQQSVTLAGDPDAPLVQRIEQVVVDPSKP